MRIAWRAPIAIVFALLLVTACSGSSAKQAKTPVSDASVQQESAPPQQQSPPTALEMGGAKSVTRFFVTSRGMGRGGDLGGLAGADAHCQALARGEGSGDHIWRAYLSATATPTTAAVNARDRIGMGPWYNALGDRVATDVDDLHKATTINQENALTERGDSVRPDATILTGSRSDGTAFAPGEDLTCGNWTSSDGGHAETGTLNQQHGRAGDGWNAARATRGCRQRDVGGDRGGLLYCFAID